MNAPSPEGIALGLILLLAAVIGVRRFLHERALRRRYLPAPSKDCARFRTQARGVCR